MKSHAIPTTRLYGQGQGKKPGPVPVVRAGMWKRMREEAQRRHRRELIEARQSRLREKVLADAPELVGLRLEDLDAIFSGRFEAKRLPCLVKSSGLTDETYDAISDLSQWAEAFSIFTHIVAKLWGEKFPALVPAMLEFQYFILRRGRLFDSATVLDFAMQRTDRSMRLTKLTNPTSWKVTVEEFHDFYCAPERAPSLRSAVDTNDNQLNLESGVPKGRRPTRAAATARTGGCRWVDYQSECQSLSIGSESQLQTWDSLTGNSRGLRHWRKQCSGR